MIDITVFKKKFCERVEVYFGDLRIKDLNVTQIMFIL